ncbi:hypothetical protein ES702_04114 [subsurface metagenome]
MSNEFQRIVGQMRLSYSGKSFVIRFDGSDKIFTVSVNSVMNLVDKTFYYVNIRTIDLRKDGEKKNE